MNTGRWKRDRFKLLANRVAVFTQTVRLTTRSLEDTKTDLRNRKRALIANLGSAHANFVSSEELSNERDSVQNLSIRDHAETGTYALTYHRPVHA